MSYDKWKEQGMDAGLDGPERCNACLDGLHRLANFESNPECECDCHSDPRPNARFSSTPIYPRHKERN